MCGPGCCNWWRCSKSAAHAATHVVNDVVQRQERCVALNVVTGGAIANLLPTQQHTWCVK
jgi:hypothetical protein